MNMITIPPRIKNLFAREINAVITIAARDVTIAVKSPGTLVVTLFMPLMMMGMLGGSLAQNMAGGLAFDYKQFMMVGMMVNMLFMTVTMGITSLVQDRTTDFSQEMMVSPVSRYSIILGKIAGASVSAILQLTGTIIIALVMGIHFSIWQLLSFLAISPLLCLAAGAFGVAIVAFIKTPNLANIIVMLIVMPQMFLSGALIPINNSSGILFILSRVMPMTYCLDLARAIFYAGTQDYANVVLFNPAMCAAGIAALSVFFLVSGTFFFAKSETNR
jgi:ABC-2 type transport system permease protein